MSDTTSANMNDTINLWLKLSNSYIGDLIMAGEHMFSGDYTVVDNILDSIGIRFNLSDDQEFELHKIGEIYSVLASKSVFEMDSVNKSELHLLALEHGIGSSIARAILSIYGQYYSPSYFIPGEITPRSFLRDTIETNNYNDLYLFPNPASNSLTIPVEDPSLTKGLVYFYNNVGKLIQVSGISFGENKIDFKFSDNGYIFYLIMMNGDHYKRGSFIRFQ